jgi:GTP-binding protein
MFELRQKKGGPLTLEEKKLRNIAIIAHVDHGKTTLVDQMLKQSGVFRENQAVAERVLDSGDLERERGITILAKNTSVRYGDVKINIVDTPGHADFGGEVARILKMVSGVLLLVDAAEGPMPQTRFVLGRALELGHRVIVVINKIDRPDARIHEVIDEVLELLLDLDATAEQLDSPMLFCSARQGTAAFSPEQAGANLGPLFDTIIDYIPGPPQETEGPLQILVSSIDYNEFVGRIAIGRIERGIIRQNQELVVCDYHRERPVRRRKAVSLYQFEGLGREAVAEASAGDIIALSGIPDITIGDTICDPEAAEPLPFVKISDPTMEMTISVNDSPFAGREGKYVTSRNLRDRLFRETLKDVSLRVSETESTEAFNVAGRGEMHLSILIETMRREGYEFQVSPPRVLYKTIDGVLCEPMERLVADVPEAAVGAVIEKVSARKGELTEMNPMGSRMRIAFSVPSRGLFGYRNEFLTDTRGEGIMASVFDGYAPVKGEVVRRNTGALVAFETGEAVTYGLYNAQERGALFIGPGTDVYAGMIVGVASKPEDITVNVCKKKQLTNMRAAGSDDALRLTPPKILSLEQCLEFLADVELLEVTPEHLRLRKRLLDHAARMRQLKSGKS